MDESREGQSLDQSDLSLNTAQLTDTRTQYLFTFFKGGISPGDEQTASDRGDIMRRDNKRAGGHKEMEDGKKAK
jgi:hypothetical protein